MTGELSLRGRVLPIGGLKEKSVAAHRNGVRLVVIPQGNARDLDDLPAEVRESVEFRPVRTMDEVLAIVMRGGIVVAAPPEAPRPAAAASSRKARDRVRAPVRDKVGVPVRDKVREPARDTVREPVRDVVREPDHIGPDRAH